MDLLLAVLAFFLVVVPAILIAVYHRSRDRANSGFLLFPFFLFAMLYRQDPWLAAATFASGLYCAALVVHGRRLLNDAPRGELGILSALGGIAGGAGTILNFSVWELSLNGWTSDRSGKLAGVALAVLSVWALWMRGRQHLLASADSADPDAPPTLSPGE